MNPYQVLAILTPPSRSAGVTGQSHSGQGRLRMALPSLRVSDRAFRVQRLLFFQFLMHRAGEAS